MNNANGVDFNRIIQGDNLQVLRGLPSASVNLVYVDPPFNTGKVQKHARITTSADLEGDRVGFGGKRYRSEVGELRSYQDSFDDFLGFLEPRLQELWRVLDATGSLFLHLDPREVHYAKVLADSLFGRDKFINEIIWSYDYGGRPKDRWPAKHDNILWYAKDPQNYTFHFDQIDRIPYMAPGLVGAEKAERGKTPTDVWWNTIVPTNSKERTGYPTQKPLGILNRLVTVHSSPGDTVLDCFAGSGSLGEAAARNGRMFIMIDQNPQAIEIMARRLAFAAPTHEGFQATVAIEPTQGSLL